MAKLFNRAKMTTSTTGSGTVTLGSASVGYQSFADAGVSNGDVVQYVIEEGSEFEIGTGTYSATGTSLTRSPTESSNSGAAISLGGAATVSITAVADDLNRLQHEGSDKVTVSSTGASVTGNISVTGTVDGRDIASDGSKLDGIESGATADQTAAEIKTAYESNSNTNAFTDAEQTKLSGIEASADVTDTANVTAAGALMDSEVTNLAQVKAFDSSDYATAAQGTKADNALPKSGGTMTGAITFASGQTFDGRDVSADGSKLDGIESGATADQTAAEIRSLVESATDSNVFTDADHTKLNGIEAGAEVNDPAFKNIAVSGQSTVVADADADTLNLAAGSNVTITTDASTDTVTIASTDTNTVPNNATITISAGNALTGGGNFTTDQASNETITINHQDTSSQASVNNSGRTYIQDITLDGYGHVTGISSATETVVNTNTNQLTTFQVEDGDGTEVTISHGKEWKFVEGTSIDINWTDTSTGSDGDPYDLTISHADTSTLSGTYGSTGNGTKIDQITVDAQGHVTAITTGATGDIQGVTAGSGLTGGGTSGTVTVSHADTSSQASVNNSNGTVIQDVTLDTYGHVTGLTSYNLDGRYYTETEADSRFVNVTGDTMTGALNIETAGGPSITIKDTDGAGTSAAAYIDFDDSNSSRIGYVGIGSGNTNDIWLYTASGKPTLGSGNGSAPQYYNGSTYQNMFHEGYHPNADKWTTARTLSLSGDASGSVSWDGSANATLSVTVADDSHNHTIANVDGLQTALDGKLSTTGKAADSELLDGVNGASYMRSDANANVSGHTQWQDNYQVRLGSSADTRLWHNGTGTYIRSYKHGQAIYFQQEDTGGTNRASLYLEGGASPYVRLFQAGSERLRTDGNGIEVTGDVDASGSVEAGTADGGAVIRTWTGSSDYAMFGTVNMTGDEYSLITNGTNTYVGAGSGGVTHIRGPANDSDPEIRVTSAEVILDSSSIVIPDKIVHEGDTNTYMQFHAADQWRVVTGGTERLEVNNSHVSTPVRVKAGDGSDNGYFFSGTDNDTGIYNPSDGKLSFATNNTERMHLNEHGGLRIGTTAFTSSSSSRVAISSAQYGDWSQRQLTIEDTTAVNGAPAIGFHAPTNSTAGIIKFWGPNAFFELRNNNDTGFYGIKASQFSVQSDYRLKENVVPLEGACDRLSSLPVHRFNFIEDIMGHGDGVTVDGFLAHEVADVVPEAVSGTKDEVDSAGNPQYQGVDQSKLVPLLTAALQEALAKIDALETRIDALEA